MTSQCVRNRTEHREGQYIGAVGSHLEKCMNYPNTNLYPDVQGRLKRIDQVWFKLVKGISWSIEKCETWKISSFVLSFREALWSDQSKSGGLLSDRSQCFIETERVKFTYLYDQAVELSLLTWALAIGNEDQTWPQDDIQKYSDILGRHRSKNVLEASRRDVWTTRNDQTDAIQIKGGSKMLR